MTIKDAIPQRHMVRKYLSKPILAETVTLLNTRIADHNARYGLNLKLVTGNSDGIGGMAKLLLTKACTITLFLQDKIALIWMRNWVTVELT